MTKNQAVIKLAISSVYYSSVKLLKIKVCKVFKLIINNLIKPVYISMGEIVADRLTKLLILPKLFFQMLRLIKNKPVWFSNFQLNR